MVKCIECNASVDVSGELAVGEIIECSNCGVELEVISSNPLKFKIFEEEEK